LTTLLPTFADLLWLIPIAIVLAMGRVMMNRDGDLGFHLTLGRLILDQKAIPLQDVFSHTLTGQPVTQHEWLSAVIFALAERTFGIKGVILLVALVIATAFWLVYKQIRTRSHMLVTAVLVTLLAITSSMIHWLIRPHIFTFLLLPLWMTALDHLRQGKLKRWWILPVLMLLWANLHGVFVIGFIAWFIYGFGVGWDLLWGDIPEDEPLPLHFWRFYLLGGVSAFLASLLNPSGIGLWTRVIGHIGNKYLADTTLEFQSPNFHDVITWPFLIYIGLLLLVLALSKKRFDSGYLFNSIAWLLLALYGARNIPLFAIVTAPLLAQGIEDVLNHKSAKSGMIRRLQEMDSRLRKIDSQLKGYVWPALSIVIVITCFALGSHFDVYQQGYTFDPEIFPVEAVNWLEENPLEGEMFNYYSWGGYLLYRGWPELQVFIDGKVDFYGEAYVRQYAQVMNLEEDWEAVLDQYNVSWVILPKDELVVRILKLEPDWELIYEDETAVILSQN
jgi:hypothetical protein